MDRRESRAHDEAFAESCARIGRYLSAEVFCLQVVCAEIRAISGEISWSEGQSWEVIRRLGRCSGMSAGRMPVTRDDGPAIGSDDRAGLSQLGEAERQILDGLKVNGADLESALCDLERLHMLRTRRLAARHRPHQG